MDMFTPGRIGSLEFKNRIVMLPLGSHYADDDGFVTDRILDYYEERAKGGVGLIIVEVSCVDNPIGKILAHMLVIDDDKYIPGLAKLAQVIKKHGAAAAIQIGHAGNGTRSKVTGMQPVGPSAVKRWGLYETPHELTINEIQELVRRFAEAAERAKRAGFDGVEFHGAHNYLISQFLSGAWNIRQDQYGGNLVNRTRFLMEIIAATRTKVGKDFPLWCRINGEEEGIDGGTTIEEAREIAKMIQGSLDAISVSAIASGAASFVKGAPEIPGALLPLARSIKEVVDIPVIGAGRLNLELGNAALEQKSIDLVGVGRGFICDPNFPNKWAAGQMEDVRPCISCYNCFSEIASMTCSVNPNVGREREFSNSLGIETKRKIVVIGGGAAGMQAARVAALMGHRVVLYEKSLELGGQLLLASIPPEKRDKIEPLTNYLITQIGKLDIEVKLGVEADQAAVDKEHADLVIVATGITPFIPDILGIEKDNVVQALDILTGIKEAGARAVVLGGELVGCETAEFLAEMGKTVVITRRGPTMAIGIHPGSRKSLMNRLKAYGVKMIPNVQYEEITDQGLVISTQSGSQLIEADTIVVAAGSRPNEKLLSLLREKEKQGGPKVLSAGDCFQPAGIREALERATRVVSTVC